MNRPARPRRKHRRQRAGASLAAVVAAVALGACGGSGGSGTSTTKSTTSGPTKAQFIAQADAICKTTETKLAPLIKELVGGAAKLLAGTSTSTGQLATPLTKAHMVAATGLTELQALAQPAGDHKLVEKFLSPLGQIVGSLATAAGGLSKGQGTVALAQLEQDQAPAQAVTSAATAYGLHGCETIFSALG
jgi:hypothetical protein